MSQDCVQADRDTESPPRLDCSNCLCVNVYYVSREALWARASTCVQRHKHRHRQDCLGVLCQETPQFGIWILYANLPLALHFQMPLYFVFALLTYWTEVGNTTFKLTDRNLKVQLTYFTGCETRVVYRCNCSNILVVGLTLENAQECPWLVTVVIGVSLRGDEWSLRTCEHEQR